MTIKEEMVDIILENVKPKMVNYARLQNFNIITVREGKEKNQFMTSHLQKEDRLKKDEIIRRVKKTCLILHKRASCPLNQFSDMKQFKDQGKEG